MHPLCIARDGAVLYWILCRDLEPVSFAVISTEMLSTPPSRSVRRTFNSSRSIGEWFMDAPDVRELLRIVALRR